MRPAGEQIMPGGRGPGGRGAGGGAYWWVCAFLSGVTGRGSRGRGKEAASLTWVRGAQVRRPGGKMIDWVPQSGVRPLGLIRPPGWPSGARAQAGSG